MLIDPSDPYKFHRDHINKTEADEQKRIIQLCKESDAPKEALYLMLERNKQTFNEMREEYRKRGMNV